MNIGIVTTWFERGAAYVSKIYMQLLQKEGHNVFIFARGGEYFPKDDANWNLPNVYWGGHPRTHRISFIKLKNWIQKNKIENVLFNEQWNFRILAKLKSKLPDVIIGAYIDYYKDETIKLFNIYDYVICNTKRHEQAFNKHKQCIYFKWGTDVNLYQPTKNENKRLTFFHSVGMSTRKGTDILLDAFIEGGLYKDSDLIVHTQIPIENVSAYSKHELEQYGIKIIEKTVTAPGLYYLGDVYVYPTRLDGLGLTMYEALSCGLPVIATDYPPMNEAVDLNVGRLVKVERNYARSDAYYWPMSICDKSDLISQMKFYINNPEEVERQKQNARTKALNEFDIYARSAELSKIFMTIKHTDETSKYVDVIKKYYKDNSIISKILQKLKVL